MKPTKTEPDNLVMSKDLVTFYSPGTFVPEETTRDVASWDVDAAIEMARGIVERHSARPFGFRFFTKGRTAEDLDSKIVKRSGFYWLGGNVETLEEIEARNDPKEEILRSNMRCNGYSAVVTNDNSWRWTSPLEEGDEVLDVEL